MASDSFVHFLRHGQYAHDEGSHDGSLTALGRRQAHRTAIRLRECSIARIYSSDFKRARETASIIAQQLKMSTSALTMLREAIPTRVPGHHIPLQFRRAAQERIKKTIARFLTRPPSSGDLLVVCHGNFINALVCRILETPLTKWRHLGVLNCGITTFRFREGGWLELRCYNDTGHLPSKLRTMF
jgi:probable phosphoglycerate mutase